MTVTLEQLQPAQSVLDPTNGLLDLQARTIVDIFSASARDKAALPPIGAAIIAMVFEHSTVFPQDETEGCERRWNIAEGAVVTGLRNMEPEQRKSLLIVKLGSTAALRDTDPLIDSIAAIDEQLENHSDRRVKNTLRDLSQRITQQAKKAPQVDL